MGNSFHFGILTSTTANVVTDNKSSDHLSYSAFENDRNRNAEVDRKCENNSWQVPRGYYYMTT